MEEIKKGYPESITAVFYDMLKSCLKLGDLKTENLDALIEQLSELSARKKEENGECKN